MEVATHLEKKKNESPYIASSVLDFIDLFLPSQSKEILCLISFLCFEGVTQKFYEVKLYQNLAKLRKQIHAEVKNKQI